MAKKKMETREYKVTGTEGALQKLDRLMALLHFNPDTSGVFGISFDGEGGDRLQVEPAPDKAFKEQVEKITEVRQGAIVSGQAWYESRPIDQYKPHWEVDGNGMKRIPASRRNRTGRG